MSISLRFSHFSGVEYRCLILLLGGQQWSKQTSVINTKLSVLIKNRKHPSFEGCFGLLMRQHYKPPLLTGPCIVRSRSPKRNQVFWMLEPSGTSMQHYYVNDRAQSTSNDHEVHRADCYWVQFIHSKTYLGYFSSCAPTVAVARTIYPDSNGCKTCSITCHTT